MAEDAQQNGLGLDVLGQALQRLKGSRSVPPKDNKQRPSRIVPPEPGQASRTTLPSPYEAADESSGASPRLDRSTSDVRFDKSRLDQAAAAESSSDGQQSVPLEGRHRSSEAAASTALSTGPTPTWREAGARAGEGAAGEPPPAASAASVTLPTAGSDHRSQLWSTGPAARPAAAGFGERRGDAGEEAQPSFLQYLRRELNPAPLFPTTDAIWGQTERQRVYNAIAYVPYQLERLMWFGTLLCCDSFLAVFTVLPVRFLRAARSAWGSSGGGGGGGGGGSSPQQQAQQPPRLQGQQLADMLCVVMFAATFALLRSLDAGAIYFWMKGLTQEFLKLQVIYTAVEMFDKITCSFAVDSLEALSGTCTLFTASADKRQHLRHLASDFAVTLALVMLHGLILLCQGMAFSVAMNSTRSSALVALTIATNFVEIKGTIFKRFDTGKLFAVTCQDVVERFHLCLALLFVAAEDAGSRPGWLPAPALAARCGQIFAAEVCIDVIKHAVLGKLNEIRPGVYRELTRDVCERIGSSGSHNVHRVVYFEPFAPAALFLRITLGAVLGGGGGGQQAQPPRARGAGLLRAAARAAALLLGWAALFAAKAVLGFWLRGAARAYVQHFERRHRRAAAWPPPPQPRAPAGAGAGAAQQPKAGKKE